MIGYDDPRREDGDENAWEQADALCEACGQRPGETAVDGAWLCSQCDAALELTDTAVLGHATPAAEETIEEAIEAEQRLAVKLADYEGKWVAVRYHEVVASADTLDDLLRLVDTASVVEAVFQVPPEGVAFFFAAPAAAAGDCVCGHPFSRHDHKHAPRCASCPCENYSPATPAAADKERAEA